MKPVICVSVAADTNDDALQKMRRAFARTDLVELRIDGIRDADLECLIGSRRGGLIVTNRRREEGGRFDGKEKERIALLEKAVQLGADYIDIEMETDQRLREDIAEAIRQNGGRTRVILSWHDFRKTPSERRLRERLKRCTGETGCIVKIVPYANTIVDNLRVLNLIAHAAGKNQAIIAFCMGEMGRLSRLMSPYFGSLISYAALDAGEATAPGQMTIIEMQEIFSLLRGDR